MGKRTVIALGSAGLLALLLVGCYLLTPQLRLEVHAGPPEGPALLSLPASPGQDFSVWFFHSYDRAFFEEHYRLEPAGRVLLTHMTFKSSLNGQGFDLGVYRSLPGGVGELADINREMEQVEFMLGSPDLANHALILGGERWRLLDYAQPGDLLSVRGIWRPRWQTLWQKTPAGKPSLAGRALPDRG